MPHRWNRTILAIGFLGFTSLWFSCQIEKTTESKNPVLAQVYNKTLVLSDIDGIAQQMTANADDSLYWLQSFVDRWVAEAILMHEAKRHIQKNIDVDKLVRDYRSSLILNNYEQALFEEELDVVITDENIEAYFSSHKEQFRLSYDIVRYIFAKAPVANTDIVTFEKWWKVGLATPSSLEFNQFLKDNSVFYNTQSDDWFSLQDLKKKLPDQLAIEISISTDLMLENNNYLYFLKVFEIGRKGELPPISFVREQVEKIILHSRKMKLLEDKKSALYQKEIKGDNVKIFTN